MTNIGTKETAKNIWQLTFNGRVLSDSDKYFSVVAAEAAARAEVAHNPAVRRLSSDVGYGHLAPRFQA